MIFSWSFTVFSSMFFFPRRITPADPLYSVRIKFSNKFECLLRKCRVPSISNATCEAMWSNECHLICLIECTVSIISYRIQSIKRISVKCCTCLYNHLGYIRIKHKHRKSRSFQWRTHPSLSCLKCKCSSVVRNMGMRMWMGISFSLCVCIQTLNKNTYTQISI